MPDIYKDAIAEVANESREIHVIGNRVVIRCHSEFAANIVEDVLKEAVKAYDAEG